LHNFVYIEPIVTTQGNYSHGPKVILTTPNVATLALGLWPRQGLAKVWAKSEPESHIPCSQKCKKVGGNEPPHSQVGSHFGVLESWWSLEYLESDCKGQNPLEWNVPYIIEKILKFKCLKWACMTHLDTYNARYGQKKGHESNWQFDSQPLKVRNCPNFL
jgi:hypothetical protein